MSVLFEGEITLMLAFRDAGGRTVTNICCRQIWWGIKLHKAPSIWQAVISVVGSFGLVSYLPHTLWDVFSQMFWRMRFRSILLILKINFEGKVWNFSLWIFVHHKFYQVWFRNGCHVLWYLWDAALIIHLKSSSGFSRNEDPMNFTVTKLLA